MNDIEIKTIEGVPMVSSHVVAERFGKRHDNVVRAIDDPCREMSEFHSSKLRSEIFKEVDLVNARNRSYRGYMMTRDGFSLLAMGFNQDAHVASRHLKPKPPVWAVCQFRNRMGTSGNSALIIAGASLVALTLSTNSSTGMAVTGPRKRGLS